MKLTKFALAVVAMMALSALTASASSAELYRSTSSPMNLNGSQFPQHEFTIVGQNVYCVGAHFNRNALATPTSELSGVVASYTSCNAFGFANATVNMGTCTYSFDTPVELTSTVDIICSSNANVEGNATNNGDIRIFATVFGSECEVHIQNQWNRAFAFWHNNNPTWGDVHVDTELIFIAAEVTKDNGLCPLSGKGVTNNGTYSGGTDLNGGESVGFEIS